MIFGTDRDAAWPRQGPASQCCGSQAALRSASFSSLAALQRHEGASRSLQPGVCMRQPSGAAAPRGVRAPWRRICVAALLLAVGVSLYRLEAGRVRALRVGCDLRRKRKTSMGSILLRCIESGLCPPLCLSPKSSSHVKQQVARNKHISNQRRDN